MSEEFKIKPYVYENPITKGYTRFYLSKKEHNKLFPYYKLNWTQYCEYYVGNDSVVIHRLTPTYFKVLETILSPLHVFMHGFVGLMEYYKRDFQRLWNEKERGAFTSNTVWKKGTSSEVYDSLLAKLKEKL